MHANFANLAPIFYAFSCCVDRRDALFKTPSHATQEIDRQRKMNLESETSTACFGARQPKRASKRNPGRRSRTRPNAPAPGRDASEVSTSTPSGVQPHFLTKTTMSNALAAPAARATTPATVRALTRLIFPGRGLSSGHGCPRCPPAGFTRGSRTPRASVPAHRTARDASPARGFPSEKRSRDARGAPRRITPCRRFDALPHR